MLCGITAGKKEGVVKMAFFDNFLIVRAMKCCDHYIFVAAISEHLKLI